MCKILVYSCVFEHVSYVSFREEGQVTRKQLVCRWFCGSRTLYPASGKLTKSYDNKSKVFL